MRTGKNFTPLVIGLIAITILIGGFFVLNNYIYQEKQGVDTTTEPYRTHLEGTYTCVPYKENDEIPTDSACEPGIQTDNNEYYAVNFFLMSQMHAPLEVGQHFSANGVIDTDNFSDSLDWQDYDIEGVFSVTDSLIVDNTNDNVACTADAKLCPDGSHVGRQGPTCEFAECPSSVTLSHEARGSLGDNIMIKDLSISPQKIMSDSRCPIDVRCVWAGTVEVRTILATEVAHGEHILTLDEPQMFGEYSITLTEVSPVKTTGSIADDSYQFKFLVQIK